MALQSIFLGATVACNIGSQGILKMLRIDFMAGVWDSLWPSHSAPVFSNFPKGRLRMETQTMQLTVQLKESIYLILIDVPFERYSVWYWVLLPYDKWCGGDVGGWRWQTGRVKRTNRDSIDAPDLKLSAWRRLFLCVFVYFPVYERVGLLEYVCASFHGDKDNMENTYFQWVHL